MLLSRLIILHLRWSTAIVVPIVSIVCVIVCVISIRSVPIVIVVVIVPWLLWVLVVDSIAKHDITLIATICPYNIVIPIESKMYL